MPALLCSMVHLTGDPNWIRSELRPRVAMLNDFQGGMDSADRAEARRRALPAIAAFRDGGCVLPPPPSAELVHEMMSFLACAPVPAEVISSLYPVSFSNSGWRWAIRPESFTDVVVDIRMGFLTSLGWQAIAPSSKTPIIKNKKSFFIASPFQKGGRLVSTLTLEP